MFTNSVYSPTELEAVVVFTNSDYSPTELEAVVFTNSDYSPTELEAVVFGHVFTLITTPLPDSRLAATVKSFPTLVKLCRKIETCYFKQGVREPEHVVGELPRQRESPSSAVGGLLELRPLRAEEEPMEAAASGTKDEPAGANTRPSSIIDPEPGENNGSNGEYDKLDDLSQAQPSN